MTAAAAILSHTKSAYAGNWVHSPRNSTLYLALYVPGSRRNGLQILSIAPYYNISWYPVKSCSWNIDIFFTKKLSISSSVSGLPYILCWRQRCVNFVVIFFFTPSHTERLNSDLSCHGFYDMLDKLSQFFFPLSVFRFELGRHVFDKKHFYSETNICGWVHQNGAIL